MMGFMFIWPVLLIGLVVVCIAGVVWALQSSTRGRSPTATPDEAAVAPEDMLRRRYAGGEITKEQFEEMRRTLRATT